MKRISGVTESRVIQWALFLCFCTLPFPARCADFQARWQELPSLLAGTEITIPLTGGATVTGDLLTIRAGALTMDVHKTSGAAPYSRGLATIPRDSVKKIYATRMRGNWGRKLGVILGQIGGLAGGTEFAFHVTHSEAAGVPSFLTIYAGSTIAGYYAGKTFDRHTFSLELLPAPPEEPRETTVAPPSLQFRTSGK